MTNLPVRTPAAPGSITRIVLAGFMGCGKTSVGRILAQRLGWRFIDLDDAVEAAAKLSVPEIFQQRGEAVFRHFELHALHALLDKRHLVLALGGGALETAEVGDALRTSPATVLVHLAGEFDTFYGRCLAQAKDPEATARPLLQTREQARERFLKRQTAYAASATHAVDATAGTPETVAAAVLSELRLPG